MTCWDDCGYQWREVGEKTYCTRTINDGTVLTAELEIEVIAIRRDLTQPEPTDHEFDAIVKIYEHYDGDPSRTLVYESIDTFHAGTFKIYYKYNEWRIYFSDCRGPPEEVYIKTAHKALCPGCFHPYICDCDDTISVWQITYTYAYGTTNNPDSEILYVELLDIASNQLSVYVNVQIRDLSTYVIKYDENHVIYGGNYVDISESSLSHDWRVNCDVITSSNAKFQLCFSFEDSGSGSGSTGSGLLAAQYFDTTAFGYTGGCIIRAETDNPKSGGGKNTAPTEVKLELYSWQGDYTSTINSDSIATDTMIIPCEILNNSRLWIPFIWDIDVPPGEYMWVLGCLRGPHDGSFGLAFIDYEPAQKWDAWVNGYLHRNFQSRILGIETTETWEKVIGVDDTFGNYYYEGFGGCSKIKINSNNEYKNILSPKTGCNYVKRGSGNVTGINLSFETGDLTGWYCGGNKMSAGASNNWASDGTYSCKFEVTDPGNIEYDDYRYIHQVFTSHSFGSGWQMLFDLYIPTDGYRLTFTVSTPHLVYTTGITAGTYLDQLVPLTMAQATFVLRCTSTYTPSASTLYVDNIRFVPPSTSDIPIGRIVDGSRYVVIE